MMPLTGRRLPRLAYAPPCGRAVGLVAFQAAAAPFKDAATPGLPAACSETEETKTRRFAAMSTALVGRASVRLQTLDRNDQNPSLAQAKATNWPATMVVDQI